MPTGRRRLSSPIPRPAVKRLLWRSSGLQVGRRAIEDQAAVVDEDDAIGNGHHLGKDVRRDQHRLGLSEVGNLFSEVADLIWIEAGCRLVDDEHVRGMQQSYPETGTPG